MSHFNSVVCGPKFTIFFRPNAEGVVVDNGFFPTFGMTIRSEDIRAQSRKLSKIAPNFGRFFALTNFRGQAFRKLYPRTRPWPAARRLDSSHGDTPTRSEVIVAHTLNFRPNFKFSGLKFFGGTPLAVPVCASKFWSICSACKNFMAQYPLRAEI